ncbi:Polysaccharide biosynthesis protein [Trichococcus flocculiformis]|uniref:oligosaccharide flippase family protein n=1 Tax=Trichococcus TaxID=82802 RepID=UPI0007A92812|nr:MULTISPECIES: oligosaccharide flippase family protein [Trichococcus]CZR11112.1 polysaccharide biosynthesis protein [Trichococcus sp. ES5]SHG29866.1 Polysaccharide biosynthesis protein [Trichococcus flocculiformis]
MNINQRKVGVILSYITLGLNALIGMIYVPLMIKYLGQQEYGLYQLMGSLISYFAIMDFGLSSTVVRFYSKYDAEKDKKGKENVLGIARRIYYVITIIMLFLGMIFSIKLDVLFGSSLSIHELQEAKKIFIMLLVNIAITLLSNIYTSIITANENFIFLKLLSIFQITIQPAAIIAVLLFTPRAFLIVVVQTLFNLLAALIKYFYCRFGIDDKIKYHYYDKNLIKGMLSFSMSIFIVSIVDQVFWKSNQIILGITAGTAIVAVYSIAAQIYMNYMPLSTVIQSVFLPSITRIAAQKGNDRILSPELFIGFQKTP